MLAGMTGCKTAADQDAKCLESVVASQSVCVQIEASSGAPAICCVCAARATGAPLLIEQLLPPTIAFK